MKKLRNFLIPLCGIAVYMLSTLAIVYTYAMLMFTDEEFILWAHERLYTKPVFLTMGLPLIIGLLWAGLLIFCAFQLDNFLDDARAEQLEIDRRKYEALKAKFETK